MWDTLVIGLKRWEGEWMEGWMDGWTDELRNKEKMTQLTQNVNIAQAEFGAKVPETPSNLSY